MPFLLISLIIGIAAGYFLAPLEAPAVLLAATLLLLPALFFVPKKFKTRRLPSVLIAAMFILIGMETTGRHIERSVCPYNDSVSTVRVMVCRAHPSSGRYDMTTREGRVVRVYMKSDSLRPGDELLVSARLRPPCRYPSGGFPSRRESLARQGICTEAFVKDWKLTGRHFNSGLRHKALVFRNRLEEKIESLRLSDEEKSVLEALTLGDKSGLAPQMRSKFSAAGLSHILSLSGMHVGIVFLMITFLLKPLRRMPCGRFVELVAGSIALWGFAFITGLAASVVRAVLMCMIYQISCLAGQHRPGRPMYTMITAAFLMLLYNPLYLFDLGFQLSFAALAGILVFVPRLYTPDLYWPGQPLSMVLMRWLKSSLALSFSAQLATTPLTIHYFSVLPITFLLTNILAAPLIPLLIFLTVIILILSFLPVSLTWAGPLLHIPLSALISISSQLGYAFHLPDIGVFTSLTIFVLILMLVFHKRVFSKVRLLKICLLSIFCIRLSALLAGLPLREAVINYDTHPWRPAITYTDERGHSNQYVKGCDRHHGLINIGGRRVLMLSDNWWNNKTASKKMKIDVLYLCPGWYGRIDQINKLFEYDQLVRSAM